jgi:hypothetical protein
MTDPTFVSVAYSLEGSPRPRSMRHIEVFFYPPDILIDHYPVEVLSEDYETPVDGRVFFGESVLPGTYEVRSFQRTCGESCDVLEPPSEGCATRMEAAPDTEVRVIVVDRPGTECAVVVEGGQTGEPERSMALTLEPQGGTGCDPASPVVGSGLPETLGTSSGVSVGWGLLWAQPPIPVGLLTKMVFRVTGDGPTEIAAIHDDGTEMVPQWGPNEHGRGSVSSYGRPGREWGMAFSFPKGGCWTVRFIIGEDTIDFWLNVKE